jgi:nucleotide-binding universal stress UspA family protein
MKKILVPTDFTPEADKVIDLVATLAKATGASIDFLNVIEPITSDGMNLTGGTESGMDNLFTLKLLERNNHLISKRANSSTFIGIDTKGLVRVEDVYTEIKNYVEAEGIDLIVMGSKGTSGVDDVVLGSTAERIVRFSPCPVLVVKSSIADFAPKNIVFATNGHDDALAGLEVAKTFQALFGSTIHLLNINTPNNFHRQSEMQAMLQGLATKTSLTNFTLNIYNDAVEEDGILEFAEANKADLIVIGTHARSGLERMLLSSQISKDVVNHSEMPVLTVRLRR